MTLKTVVKKGQSVLSLLSEEEKKKYQTKADTTKKAVTND